MPGTISPADPAAGVLGTLGRLLRPELADLAAYVPHDPPGIEVKLDANEAPAPPALVSEVAARALAGVALERYPDPLALRLKSAIARRTGAAAGDLLVGTGSDELIALLVNALSVPRGRAAQAVVLTPTPTFVMYRMTARSHGVKPVEVPLDASWDLDAGTMSKAITMMQPNVVFIASPNNPTGNRVREERLDAVIRAAGEAAAFVVLDEAYIDYSGPGASLRGWRARHPHLGILRTVSKIGLAALRVGWLEADPALLAEIDKTRQPFNVSATSQIAAAAVLEDAWDAVQAGVADVVARREELSAAIGALPGFTVTPSGANFLWVKTPGPAAPVFEQLARDGVLVRSFHKSGGRLGTQLRITIGTSAQHERLLASLARVPA
ncbi:MAG: Histidinol-phosphate aminotransferase [Labilithrix sp.]|nr:Histidinol-phosphate aminotransferase [Labilithrix sp.]